MDGNESYTEEETWKWKSKDDEDDDEDNGNFFHVSAILG